MNYLSIFLCALLCSLLFVYLMMKKPIRDKKSVSCLGGVGIYTAFLIASLVGFILKGIDGEKLLGIILSGTLVLILGIIDDVKELKPLVKIFGEVLGVLILVMFGFMTKIVFFSVWVNFLITLIWILLITNAFNLLDILDGLASGLIIIISLTLLVISLVNRDILSSVILISLAGAHIGFLRYNYPPAKIYMGDAGSLFSGFILGVIAINISYAPMERSLALLTPLLALSLPIYDTLFLIVMRINKKEPVFKKTNDHFAIRLKIMNNSLSKSIWHMYVFSFFIGVCSLIVAFSSSMISVVTLIVVLLVFIIMGKKISIVEV